MDVIEILVIVARVFLFMLMCVLAFLAIHTIWHDMGLRRYIRNLEVRVHSKHSRIWAVTVAFVVAVIFGTSLAESLLVPPKPPVPYKEKTLLDSLHACVTSGYDSTRNSPLCTKVGELVREQQDRLAKLESK